MALLAVLTLVFLFLTAYVYAGYPLLLLVLQKIAKRPIARGDSTPPVSLIIAAYNEQVVIAEKIENSLQLDYPRDRLEIMVVADGSSDRTAEIVRSYAAQGVVLLDSPERRGKSAALNRGVKQASGEILIFSDANAFYYEDAIRKLVRNFDDPAVGCVSGKKTVRSSTSAIAESEGLYWKYESFIKKRESATGSTVGVVGEMNAIRASLYEPIPEHIINDDAFLALRVLSAGKRVLYEAEAVSWETPALTTRDEVIRRQRINAGRYQQMLTPRLWSAAQPFDIFKLFSHKFLRLMLPFFMVGALIFNTMIVLMPAAPLLLQVTFWGQIAAYVLALVGYLTEKSGKKIRLAAAAWYVVSSNAASLSGFLRYMRRQQTVLWEKAQRAASE